MRGQALNRPMRGTPYRGRTARTASYPAPTLGLNARDSIANMKPGFAIVLDNWFPQTTSVALRNGSANWKTGFTSEVDSLLVYKSSSSSKMFAASGTAIYDATSSGAIGTAVVTAQSSARWQSVNFGTPGGQFLVCVNGLDYIQEYDGTTWKTINGTSTPAITGVDTSLFKDVQVYASRLWFTERNSFRVWYLPVNSIAGAASSIDLSSLFRLGGSLQGMVTWTVAAELATTQYAAFISSEGEGLLYTGINPDNATGFNLVGTFRVGKPIGQRFYARVGTDTVLITQDGIVPLSEAVINNRQSQSDAVSYVIENMVNDDVALYGGQFGWTILLYPLGNKIILNSPRPTSSQTVQYVMNTLTNAWCRYTGLKSYCWALFNDQVFFGSDTTVVQAETGNSDLGQAISADVMPAYSYFQAEGAQKLFTAVRPIVQATGSFMPSLGIATDFAATPPFSQPQLTIGVGGAVWNIAVWNVAMWGDTLQTNVNWQTIGGLGFAATVRMQTLTKNVSASWQAIDFAYEVSKSIY